MKSSTLRAFQTVHTWTGVMAGFALFVAFYAGALTMFHDDIATWQMPPWRSAADAAISPSALVDALIRQHPQAQDFGIVLPHTPGQSSYVFWNANGHMRYATASQLAAPVDDGRADDLADFVYALHDSLGIPVFGLYFMGVVSMLYGLAITSGFIFHLPQLVKDLFALRVGKNLKRLWQDAHTTIGVLSLPFHVMFAITGAAFCLTSLLLTALDATAFDGKLMAAFADATRTAPVVEAAHQPASMLSFDALVARARHEALAAGAAGFEPDYAYFSNYGDRNATVMIRGLSDRTLGSFGHITLDGATGRPLMTQAGAQRDANSLVFSAMYSVHFGNFGGRMVQWLYFLLGLAGAFLFYSGNLLWIEARRKRRHADQPLKTRVMARATVGICIGSCLAISGAFAATALASMLGIDAQWPQHVACFGLFLAACAYACARPVASATVELLVATGMLTLIVVLTDLLRNARAWMQPWSPQTASVFGVDGAGMVLGAVFLLLARASWRRARQGEQTSVWATQPRTSLP
ncbi:PepSY-associated TM helix domain-containing protein [Dyella sp.]|uniref:PepSY-associated TM helix domain-containing protein n=1 Tax=Dyella sp. TaxID=1869338 RepID=UPI002ED1F5E1